MPQSLLPPGEQESGSTSIRELWDSFRRQRWAIAATMATTLALAAALVVLIRPLYESDATLRIIEREELNSILSELPDVADLMLPTSRGSQIETEMGVLRSRRIAEEVVGALSLQVQLRTPKVPRDSILRVLSAPANASKQTFVLRRQADGSYETEVNGQRRRVEVGEPITLGEIEIALSPSVEDLQPRRIRLAVSPFHRSVERFRETFSIEQQAGRSELVEVTYRSTDRLLAAQVVETAVDRYLQYRETTDHADLRRRVETLHEQVDSYQSDLEVAENELRDYRERFRIVEPTEEAIEQVQMVAAVRAERERALIERDALVTTIGRIQRDAPAADLARQLSAFPTFITNAGVQSILTALTTTEDARSNLLLLRTPENPDVQRLDERIDELSQQLYQLATSYLSSLEDQVASADSALARFGAEARDIPQRELEYARLTRQQRLLNEIYLTLQAQLEEASVQYATAPEDVRVVDSALLPVDPAWPRPMITFVLAGILGLLLGMMVSVGREAVDTTIRSQWDAEAIAGFPVVGAIPRLNRKRVVNARTFSGRFLRLPSTGLRFKPSRSALSPAADDPDAADALRAIPASISARPDIETTQLVLVTSALDGDGKSITSVNLALVLAQSGLRTLLIDADLRNGSLHEAVNGAQGPGLSELLRGATPREEAIQELPIPNTAPLHFLASGTRRADPARLLESSALRELLIELRGEYDRIVIDAPALLRDAGAALVATLADAVLLVVRSGATDKDALRQAAVRLERMHIPVAGMILNDVDSRFGWLQSRPAPTPGDDTADELA